MWWNFRILGKFADNQNKHTYSTLWLDFEKYVF